MAERTPEAAELTNHGNELTVEKAAELSSLAHSWGFELGRIAVRESLAFEFLLGMLDAGLSLTEVVDALEMQGLVTAELGDREIKLVDDGGRWVLDLPQAS